MKLKLNARPIALFLPVLLALTACGQVAMPGISRKVDNNAVMRASVIDLAKFTNDCSAKGGALRADNTVCVTASTTSIPSSSGNMQDIPITQEFKPGMAITASGNSTGNLVQIYLNTSWVANLPVTAFYRINGSGTLIARTQPGSWSNVTVTVYTCFDQFMQQVYCPAI